eukprot:768373-Prymnesium_polylepis.1
MTSRKPCSLSWHVGSEGMKGMIVREHISHRRPRKGELALPLVRDAVPLKRDEGVDAPAVELEIADEDEVLDEDPQILA